MSDKYDSLYKGMKQPYKEKSATIVVQEKAESNEIKEVENYLNENLLAIYVNGEPPFGYMTREGFENFIPSEDFGSCIIVDLFNKYSYDCNIDGNIIGSRNSNEFELNLNVYSVFGQIPLADFLGMPIEIPILEKQKENKEQYTGRPVNVPYISLIDNNIRKFHEIEDVTKLKDETSVERLIKTALIDSDQFDEIFTVEKDRPESPLMRRFLTKLAQLVNEGLETLKDEGLENIEELQKVAYKYAGYRGKTFETVLEEQKDYDAYFRFLLTKDEKIVITEEQKDYFDKLKSLAKKEIIRNFGASLIGVKKKNRDVELKGTSPCPSLTGTLFFTGLVPSLSISKTEVKATYFTYVEDIYQVYSEIENSQLSLKVALNSDLILENEGNPRKGVEVTNSIFVCDRNFNYAFFQVKKSTLNKWKKSLSEKIVSTHSILITKSMTPRGFSEFIL